MQDPDQMPDGRVIYRPDGSILTEFLLDRKPVSVIQGPVGSGKSKGSNIKVFAIAAEQKPNRQGMRVTRWGVIRNTYPELKNTTIRTWIDTFPENEYGKFRWSVPYQQIIRVEDVVIEVDFLALDKDEDIKKIRSGEYTGFYINELQYIPKAILDECTSRAGRFPKIQDGGPTWSGVIADMNAPEEDHFMAIMTGQVEMPSGLSLEEQASYAWPDEWGFYMQPPGLKAILDRDGGTIGYEPNPEAENVKWLKPNYYLDQTKGKTKSWIDSRLMNIITVIVDGNPVFKNFRREIHVATQVIKPAPNHEIFVGLDFGRQPAAVFGQTVGGRVSILDELQGYDESSTVFAPKVKALLERKYPRMRVRFIGDPKGQDKNQTDERTAYEIFGNHGMHVEPAPVPTNNIKTRIEAVDYCLTQLVDGKPKLQISPICRALIAAMAGKYHYRKNDVNKAEPVKDKASNIADAKQYLILGMGEGKAMIGLDAAHRPRPVVHKGSRGAGRRVG